MPRDGGALPPAVHLDGEIHVLCSSSEEARSELRVQLAGSRVGDGPGEDWHTETVGGDERRLSRAAVVRVTGDAAEVEHEQGIDLLLCGERVHDVRELFDRKGCEPSILVGQQVNPAAAQFASRLCQLPGPHVMQAQ